jgi:3-phenylpropionate/cinnamic acid dioxygenase small subunit
MSLTRELESFLYHEAALLDDRNLDEWGQLFREDGVYAVPLDASRTDPTRDPHIIYDDHGGRQERIYRLLHTHAHSQSPPSRTMHIVGNIRRPNVPQEQDGLVSILSNQAIFELRPGDAAQVGLGERRALAAHVQYLIDVGGQDPTIVLKRVLLLDSDLSHFNLSFLL